LECLANQYNQDSLPLDIKLYKVEWAEQQEELTTVRRWATEVALQQLDELLAARLSANAQPVKRRKKVKISRPTIMPADRERVYDVTIGDPLLKKLVIHTAPFNPHAHVAPLGSRCV
jgi:hypothetical protein